MCFNSFNSGVIMTNAAITFQIFPQNIQEQIHDTLDWHSHVDRIELTEREQEVLQIMSLAWNDQESALALNISLNTYRVHRKNILNKFNAKSQVEALARAFRSKLIQ